MKCNAKSILQTCAGCSVDFIDNWNYMCIWILTLLEVSLHRHFFKFDDRARNFNNRALLYNIQKIFWNHVKVSIKISCYCFPSIRWKNKLFLILIIFPCILILQVFWNWNDIDPTLWFIWNWVHVPKQSRSER